MRTAVIVLGVLGIVFGFIGAAMAFGITDAVAGASRGAIGREERDQTLWALGAVVLAMASLSAIGRWPRMAGAGLLISAVAGIAGTPFFLIGSLLLGFAGVLAFFISRATEASRNEAPSVGAGTPSSALRALDSLRLKLGGRRLALAAGGLVVLLVIGGVFVSQASADDERAPVKALFAGMSERDSKALATLAAPSSRSGEETTDASLVLSLAFEGSGLELLGERWISDIAGRAGVTVNVRSLSVLTVFRNGAAAIVEADGEIEIRHTDVLIDLALAPLRGSFSSRIPVVKENGRWFVDLDRPATSIRPPRATSAVVRPTATVAPASTDASRTVAPARTQEPTPVPVPVATPAPTHPPLDLGWSADLSDPAHDGLPLADQVRYELEYTERGALMSECEGSGADPCLWLFTAPTALSAVTATARIQGEVGWGIVMRATDDRQHLTFGGLSSSRHCVIGSFSGSTFTGPDIRIHESVECAEPLPGGDRLTLVIDGSDLVLFLNDRLVLRASDPQLKLGARYGIEFFGDGLLLLTSFGAR